MPLFINDAIYYTVEEIAQAAGVSRVTVWRWRKEGLVPEGRRYRGRERLYTISEADAIYQFAHRLEEPASIGAPHAGIDQLTLFTDDAPGTEEPRPRASANRMTS